MTEVQLRLTLGGATTPEGQPRYETLSLDNFDPRRLARRTDAPSSHEAARRVVRSGRARGHEERILRALQRSMCPLTAKEIGRRVGLTNVQVARRLGRQGRLRLSGAVTLHPARDTATGEQLFFAEEAA